MKGKPLPQNKEGKMIMNDVHDVANITLDDISKLPGVGSYSRHIRMNVGKEEIFIITVYADNKEDLEIKIRRNEVVKI